VTDTPKTKPAFVIKNFRDAGTEERHAKGTIVPIEEGALSNYVAAGLVREPTAEDQQAARTTAAAESKAEDKAQGGKGEEKPKAT